VNQKVVLLVEDEHGVRKMAKTALQRAGFAVIEAEELEDALKLWEIHQGRVDLLVTDLPVEGSQGVATSCYRQRK